MRIGQNPVKAMESIAAPAPVTVVVISSIPFLSGYYEHSLELLKLCLASIRANTTGEYDLMVFDNGSCAEVRNFLLSEQTDGRLQFLTLSERNLGKPAAWNSALLAAPGELVAYADSDVYFYPGWLEATKEVFHDFPEAGMVTAMPILTPEKYSTATVKWARKQKKVKVERGEFFPWDDFWRHARSLGDTEGQARKFYKDNEAIRLSYRAHRVYAGAAHFQFTAPKSVLRGVLPINAERPMGRVRLLDGAINQRGYLRLSTEKWYVQHLGNQMPQPGDLVDDAEMALAAPKKKLARSGIWRWAPIRKALQWLYGWSFDRLHRGGQK